MLKIMAAATLSAICRDLWPLTWHSAGGLHHYALSAPRRRDRNIRNIKSD